MEYREKIKFGVTITCCVAVISIFLTTNYLRKHRKQQQKQSQITCYLKTEEPKPQSSFKRVLADNSYSPFKHLNINNNNECTEHPYKAEIEALLKSPVVEFDEGNVGDLELRDSYVWIETESQLVELVDVLSKERLFAVDTEQHGLRSFLGFTALIQISTQREDYLVDTIALHDVMGVLRPVFANAAICKVFHGADNDVIWLQRDFHIYVVNLFDTAKACEVLSKPQKSLAYLLETYCGIATNKQLQREDWRQRPLPVEMVQYAQTDAHFLLYIARCLASELRQRDSENSACPDDKFRFLLEASRRSNAICLQLFSKEIEAFPGESAASSIMSRTLNDRGGLSSHCQDKQFQDLVRRLCAWRDLMARMHDESLRYVLSDHAIVALAHKVPSSEVEIYDAITQADLDNDSLNLISTLQSPSSVICSHLEDFDYLFHDDMNLEEIFLQILQKHLGPNGSCPFSIYNYALLSRTNLKLANTLASKKNGFRRVKQAGKKASRQLFVQKFSCKAPVYHNCRIYANDGRLLCYCDRRKLEWYLHRDLAKLVEEDPQAIMLLFEPKGRPEDEGNDFYIQSKKNICVGCGEGNHYLRYRIIPSCYRMHFLEHLKSHRSHDIVLLCVDCHEVAHAAAEKYKRQIATEFGIPLFVRKVVDSTQDQDSSGSSATLEEAGVSPLQLRTAAMALLRHGPRMPVERREELMQIVSKYYGGREISMEDLEKALLVGMSPHERRRLQKKKGLALKRTTGDVFPEEDSRGDMAMSVTVDTSDMYSTSGPQANTGETCSEVDSNLLVAEDLDVSGLSLCPDSEVNGEILDADNGDLNPGGSRVSESKCIPVLDTNVNEGDSPSSGTVNLVHHRSDGTIAPKHSSKLSLLGHGPHGKQVVDRLLEEYGEDGIRHFCQKWRQVFVEAINPRFLPAGWDVMHSGRRDFGDFSVYNPAKRASAAAKS